MSSLPDRRVRYARLYTDLEGESHFVDEESETNPDNFAPPAPNLNLSEYVYAKRFAFLILPKGWYGDWHTSPDRQFIIFLSGEAETTASDGKARRFKQGDILLLEDTKGKGHTSKSVGGDVVIAVVQLVS